MADSRTPPEVDRVAASRRAVAARRERAALKHDVAMRVITPQELLQRALDKPDSPAGAMRVPDFLTALRHASFNTVSLATSSGYMSTDYDQWPIFAPMWMMFLAAIASSSGSTGGGIKMIRVLIMLKQAGLELRRMVHPRAVTPLTLTSGTDVKAEDVAFNNRKNSNVLRTKKENVPDWAENTAPVTETPLDPDEERLINERIARLKTSQKREA